MLELHRKIQLVKLSIGLIISHIVMGIFQERIMKRPYVDDDGNSFQFALAIAYVSVQCFFYTLVSVGQQPISCDSRAQIFQKFGIFWLNQKKNLQTKMQKKESTKFSHSLPFCSKTNNPFHNLTLQYQRWLAVKMKMKRPRNILQYHQYSLCQLRFYQILLYSGFRTQHKSLEKVSIKSSR